jgi:hypothetical protein
MKNSLPVRLRQGLRFGRSTDCTARFTAGSLGGHPEDWAGYPDNEARAFGTVTVARVIDCGTLVLGVFVMPRADAAIVEDDDLGRQARRKVTGFAALNPSYALRAATNERITGIVRRMPGR